jgi:hypothetical protein
MTKGPMPISFRSSWVRLRTTRPLSVLADGGPSAASPTDIGSAKYHFTVHGSRTVSAGSAT